MDYSRDIDKLRHTASHVLAQAVKELWPDVKVTIGPAIDNGFYYDFDKKEPFTDDDLRKIEKAMYRIVNRNLPMKQSSMKRDEAIKLFRSMKEDYKVELIENLPDQEVSIFHTGDEFLDLCKGPHIPSTGAIKGLKLLSVAGAYWRGDEKKPMLQRIYGTAFFTQKELDDYLERVEEARRRDHRRLGRELGLFTFSDLVGPGLPLWLPKGAAIRRELER